MGLLDKLQFWKKSDDDFLNDFNKPPSDGFGMNQKNSLGNDPLGNNDIGSDPMSGFNQHSERNQFGTLGSPDFGTQTMQSEQRQSSYGQHDQQMRFTEPQHQSNNSNDIFMVNKNIELLSSKMDALRASLESMNQRLINIERIAQSEQQDYRGKW